MGNSDGQVKMLALDSEQEVLKFEETTEFPEACHNHHLCETGNKLIPSERILVK